MANAKASEREGSSTARHRVPRWLKMTGFVVLSALAIAVGAFLAWALTPLGPEPTALRALEGSSAVSVEKTSGGYEFVPRSTEPSVGLVIYPGGRVDARSYAPLAMEIAERGYLVVITPMPLSLAVFSPNAAAKVIDEHPEVRSWAVGGHSLGGAMAAQYVARNASSVDGLVLLAAYAPDGADLSESDVQALDLVGSRDGVLNQEVHAEATSLLPSSTRAGVIDGGNHAQFGDYGPQPGDNEATIPAARQWLETADEVDELLSAAAAH
ncbi:MAG TPA: alpha/beta fold hydrolase [Coriobacteriia bacterium]|nr:alpha/beta fold hydrolase [Coriobacteriia bacterium]